MVPAIPRRSKSDYRHPPARWNGDRQLLALVAGIVLLAASALGRAAPAPDEALSGPDIVIIAEEERTIYEFRQGGELRMIRIEPRIGKPYYLVPRDNTRGFGNLERADMLIPSWVILQF